MKIEKPEGHDLNEKRAEKAGDSSAWLPENAFFDTYERMKGSPPTAILILWADQAGVHHFAAAGPSNSVDALLLNAVRNLPL